MKRIICLLLSFVMLFGVSANALSNNKYISYVVSNGLIDHIPEDDSLITRQDAAMMLGRAIGVLDSNVETAVNPFVDVDKNNPAYKEILALNAINVMVGNEGYFHPHDTISREEFAKVLECIYRIISNEVRFDEEVFAQRFIDFDEISTWARQSVVNLVKKGIFKADKGKKFRPKDALTFSEAADAVYRVATTTVEKYVFTEGVASGNPEEKYKVYQKAGILTEGGVAGFGMVARFNGAPGEIYVSRMTKKPEQEDRSGNPVSPVVLARVMDPDGHIIARVRLDDNDNGFNEKVISIKEGKAGIYQIQIINGRVGDEVAIGINNPVSWGIRGEVSFKYTQTTPKDGYIWIPEKFENASMASNAAFSLKTEDDKLVASSVAKSMTRYSQSLEAAGLTPQTVYKISVPETFNGKMWIEGIPRLICPTAEMARDLKGNYVMTSDGTQCHGPLQARAYEIAQQIYYENGGDFSVDFSGRPEEIIPEELHNPLAESYNFGIYNGFISSAKVALEAQCLIPGPYLGFHMINKLEDARKGVQPYEGPTWEVGNYKCPSTDIYRYVGLLTQNSELNYFYGEDGLSDRIALMLLYLVYSATDDGWCTDVKNTASAGAAYASTYGNFCMGSAAKAFAQTKNYLEPEVRAVLEEGFEMICDKNMNYRGNGPSNQWGFGIKLALHMWLATGNEYYHDYFKRAIAGFNTEELWGDYLGVSPAGYPIESTGADGNYFYMNITDYAEYHTDYTKNPNADPETVKNIQELINKALEFEKFFIVTAPVGLARVNVSHFTSRTNSTIGSPGGHSAWTDMVDEYPLARRFWNLNTFKTDENGVLLASTGGALIGHYVNSDEYAIAKIKLMYPKYDQYYGDDRTNSTSAPSYETMLKREFAEPGILPCEDEDQVWEHPGIFALKHKGIYISSFYNSTLPDGKMSNNSWLGGGPSVIWAEGTGGVSASNKHEGYSGTIKGENDVKSSCVFGTTMSGTLMVSGKEIASLNKLDDKTYVISGYDSKSGKTVNWKYELADDGVIITPSVEPLGSDEDFYINLPIAVRNNEEYRLSFDVGRLACEYKGAITEFTWDSSLEAELLDEDVTGNAYRRLRIKLSSKIPASIKIKTIKESTKK